MDKIPIQIINTINLFRHSIESRFDIKKIFLFGSYAKGKFSEFSDIDICIVADNIGNSFSAILSVAPDVVQTDLRIEPVFFNSNEFNEMDFGLIGEIKRNGIEIKKESQSNDD